MGPFVRLTVAVVSLAFPMVSYVASRRLTASAVVSGLWVLGLITFTYLFAGPGAALIMLSGAAGFVLALCPRA